MRADNLRSAVIDEIDKVVRRKSIINRHEDGANLRDRIKRFQLSMRVRRNVSDAIALHHVEAL